MGTFRTQGHQPAVEAVRALLAGGLPHAVLLVGPPSVGKATLALDVAAALLCGAADPADRPCRSCRSCRLVDHGNHPDLHRVAPEGAAGRILIGQIRSLLDELALLPVEGAARAAIIEGAHAMNEPAQHALLKTLEEPPAGLTLLLAADDEDALLPTVRSRCARVRLGPLPAPAVARLLADRADSDPVDAARIARLAGGRVGLALGYARNPDALVVRTELSRSLLDLFGLGRAARLAAVRDLLVRAADLRAALAPPVGADEGAGGSLPGRRSRRGSQAAPPAEVTAAAADAADGEGAGSGARTPAVERRRSAAALVATWRDVVIDLVRVGLGDPGAVREPELLEEYRALAGSVATSALAGFLARLDDAALRLDASASSELLVDVLAVSLPRPAVAP